MSDAILDTQPHYHMHSTLCLQTFPLQRRKTPALSQQRNQPQYAGPPGRKNAHAQHRPHKLQLAVNVFRVITLAQVSRPAPELTCHRRRQKMTDASHIPPPRRRRLRLPPNRANPANRPPTVPPQSLWHCRARIAGEALQPWGLGQAEECGCLLSRVRDFQVRCWDRRLAVCSVAQRDVFS